MHVRRPALSMLILGRLHMNFSVTFSAFPYDTSYHLQYACRSDKMPASK